MSVIGICPKRICDRMTLSIASNIASVRAQRNLGQTTTALGETFQRLSSGLRINSAKDDPAGLILADNLRADARLASVAVRNANDGISITSIADAALGEIGNILSRMAELAEQSANGVYTNTQRSAMSSEFLALGSEIQRIAISTEFNGVNILSNGSNISVQVGIDGTANSRVTIEGVSGLVADLGIGNASGALTYSIISTSEAGSTNAATNALSAISTAISTLGSTRGKIGAAESRLGYAINVITVARENFIAAESRIRDADIAQEVAEMVRLQVLQQAGTAILAQANQQPAAALALLG